ncbi:MAG: CoA pyrophosphatase [Betaproteobacteria bacterium]|nr:CoA pyrophosphatase [Betaproteobacteria bacterium]
MKAGRWCCENDTDVTDTKPPIEQSPGSSRYDAQWLRRRVAQGRVVTPVREPGAGDGCLPASVLVPVINRAEGLTVLFTQRTTHLHDHPGQVAFPGGRAEISDPSPVDTALRETWEEIGIVPARVEVLGILPQYLTGTGFQVTPVVGLVGLPLELRLDAFEVAHVFETPLEFLLDPANHQRHVAEIRGTRREYWAMPYDGHFIWGATAGMVVSLYRHLFCV